MEKEADHTLEYLLAFDGAVHHYPDGYYLKFEIKRVPASGERPHGLRYSFTLHAPDGARLVGFDNAHVVSEPGSKFKKRPETADHLHRTEDDVEGPTNLRARKSCSMTSPQKWNACSRSAASH